MTLVMDNCQDWSCFLWEQMGSVKSNCRSGWDRSNVCAGVGGGRGGSVCQSREDCTRVSVGADKSVCPRWGIAQEYRHNGTRLAKRVCGGVWDWSNVSAKAGGTGEECLGWD